MTNLQELKRLAKAATPGPWNTSTSGSTVTSNQYHPIARITEPFHRQLSNGKTGEDASFIAAANPAVVLSLLERIEKLEGQLAEYRKWAAVTPKPPNQS